MNRGGAYDHAQWSHSGWNYLTLLWTSAASGAVPTSYPSGYTRATDDLKIPARTGTGAYTIPLGTPMAGKLFGIIPYLLQATYANTGACSMYLVEDKSSDVTTPEIKILITNAAGTAVDPTTSDVVGITLITQLVSVS
jgi:hypothetical protein